MSGDAAMSGTPADPPLRVMVASTVHHFEDQLSQIAGVLHAYGYEVWNSHLGTIPTHPGKSNLEICLQAVRSCDLFLGIIRPFYGSGKIGERSITHEEMRLAVALGKPRWVLVHGHVTFARQLLRPLRYDENGSPRDPPFTLPKTAVMDDLRVLDMYEEIIRSDVPVRERVGHWVQEYHELGTALRYVEAQLRDVNRVRGIIKEMTAGEGDTTA